jgi:hypothetical protein
MRSTHREMRCSAAVQAARYSGREARRHAGRPLRNPAGRKRDIAGQVSVASAASQAPHGTGGAWHR